MKIKSLFFVAILLSIISCGKDNDNLAESIIGTWQIVQLEYSDCDDSTDNINIEVDDSGCTQDQIIEICMDGTMTFTNTDLILLIELSSDGSSLGETRGSSNYTVDGNTLTICDSVNDCEDTAINLSGNTLTITIMDDDDGCLLRLVGER